MLFKLESKTSKQSFVGSSATFKKQIQQMEFYFLWSGVLHSVFRLFSLSPLSQCSIKICAYIDTNWGPLLTTSDLEIQCFEMNNVLNSSRYFYNSLSSVILPIAKCLETGKGTWAIWLNGEKARSNSVIWLILYIQRMGRATPPLSERKEKGGHTLDLP
jgi:hypothetical protein